MRLPRRFGAPTTTILPDPPPFPQVLREFELSTTPVPHPNLLRTLEQFADANRLYLVQAGPRRCSAPPPSP